MPPTKNTGPIKHAGKPSAWRPADSWTRPSPRVTTATSIALHLLVKGLELAVDGDDADLERAIRINLTAWRTQLIRRRALVPHANWVWAVTYSPDGQRWATASRDRTAQRLEHRHRRTDEPTSAP